MDVEFGPALGGNFVQSRVYFVTRVACCDFNTRVLDLMLLTTVRQCDFVLVCWSSSVKPGYIYHFPDVVIK